MHRVLFAILALVVPIAAQAAPTLPAAIYKGSGSDPGINLTISSPGTYSHTYNDPINLYDSGEFTVTIAGTPDPMVVAAADASLSTITAGGQLWYYMEIVGGSGPAPVTLDLSASLSASSYGDGGSSSAMGIDQVSGLVGSGFANAGYGTSICSIDIPCFGPSWSACSVAEGPGFCYGAPDSLSLTTTVNLMADTLYQIEISAGASGLDPLVPYVATGGGRATVDPSFAIDPITIDAGAYSLIFSDGIGNPASGPGPSSVPEPATWAVLLAGIGMLGALRRAQRVIAA